MLLRRGAQVCTSLFLRSFLLVTRFEFADRYSTSALPHVRQISPPHPPTSVSTAPSKSSAVTSGSMSPRSSLARLQEPYNTIPRHIQDDVAVDLAPGIRRGQRGILGPSEGNLKDKKAREVVSTPFFLIIVFCADLITSPHRACRSTLSLLRWRSQVLEAIFEGTTLCGFLSRYGLLTPFALLRYFNVTATNVCQVHIHR